MGHETAKLLWNVFFFVYLFTLILIKSLMSTVFCIMKEITSDKRS